MRMTVFAALVCAALAACNQQSPQPAPTDTATVPDPCTRQAELAGLCERQLRDPAPRPGEAKP